jgi:cell division protein FtsB
MKSLLQNSQIIRRNLIAIVGLFLSVYFCYHILAGERSYLRLHSLERQISQTTQEYNTLSKERLELEQKVVMMRPGSIDKDLLEERVRAVLGYRTADERILVIAN